VTTQLIILNGGSSSGKSSIVRCLQAVLPDPWLAFGCDSFVDAVPAKTLASAEGLVFGSDGEVGVGAGFRALEAAWMTGVAAMARAGARIIIDDVFLGQAQSQRRWREALGGLPVLWVGIRCASEVAEGREVARGNRAPGTAAAQADAVHQGVVYDLEVDTARTESLACARAIAAHVG
jgi:chloramphenicol 3-O phosphotransferase